MCAGWLARAPPVPEELTELPCLPPIYTKTRKDLNVSTRVGFKCERRPAADRSARTGQPARHERQQLSDPPLRAPSFGNDALTARWEIHSQRRADDGVERPRCRADAVTRRTSRRWRKAQSDRVARRPPQQQVELAVHRPKEIIERRRVLVAQRRDAAVSGHIALRTC